MIDERYKYSETTSKIIGCAMEVHKILGNGFQELIYQRALAEEFQLKKSNASREYEMNVMYKGKVVGTRRVDFLIDNVISVEIKAIIKLEEVHLAQALNYLEAYNLEIGMLLNFGAKNLEYRRLINSKFTPDSGNKANIHHPVNGTKQVQITNSIGKNCNQIIEHNQNHINT